MLLPNYASMATQDVPKTRSGVVFACLHIT